MKKVLTTTLVSTLLLTGVASPVMASENITTNENNATVNNQKSNEQIAREVLKSQGYNLNNVGEDEGKVKVTVKGAIEILKRNKTRINNAIKGAIDKIPMSKEAKAKWKKAITVDVILGYLTAYTDWGDRVEDAIYNAILKTGAPWWVAKPIAVTIAFLIPIL